MSGEMCVFLHLSVDSMSPEVATVTNCEGVLDSHYGDWW